MGKQISGKRRSLRAKMMGINVTIACSSLLLCGFLFVMAVAFMVGRYVKQDLDFFLIETSSNLGGRLEYMEDVLLRVRSSADMLEWLGSTETEEEHEPEFREVVDISHSKNQGNEGEPVTDKAYLFREDGACLSDFYYALVYSEVHENNLNFQKVWQEYLQLENRGKGFLEWCRIKDGNCYMAYPVLDDRMNEVGVLIFEIDLGVIEQMMEKLRGYEGAFWMLYNNSTVIDSWNSGQMMDLREKFRETESSGSQLVNIGGINYRTYSKDLCLNMRVTAGIPENQARMILYSSVNVYMIGIVVIMVAGLLSFGIFTYKITKPMKEITNKLERVREGDFETKLPDYQDKEFHEISQVFNQMTEYINHLVNQVYEKQIAVKEMELKFFQTQMNPHFMFNVLNSISLQARIDGNDEISRLISTFSRLIQAKIYRSESEKVQIYQELEYVKYYLAIQQFRYGERISYHIEVKEEEILKSEIPKLSIQMIVENAIVHGLEPKTGDGRVDIIIERHGNDVVIEVADNGIGFGTDGYVKLPLQTNAADESHNHVGLNNVHHIIQLMYGEPYGVSIYSKKNQGVSAKIRIPLDFPLETV